MSDSVRKIWENAMINLVIEFPIYAELVTKIGCKFVHGGTNEETSACAWTDGRSISINEDMVEHFNLDPIIVDNTGKEINRTIGQKEMQFIICHELLHLIGLTFDRMKNVGLYREDISDEARRKFELWNQATDYEINSLLHNNESTDQAYGDRKRNPVGNMPEWVLYDSEYKDMPAEEIFKILVEKEKKENGGMLLKPGNSGASGTGKNGMIPLDDHLPIQDEDVKNEVISKMSEVFGNRNNGLGESGIDRMVSRTYKPVPFNWRKALSKYIRGYIKANYTWNKPSRAGIASGLILPSAGTTPKLHIGVAIDTSGSISEKEIDTMMNHVFTILQQFKSFEIDIWSCGSKVYTESLLKLTGSNKGDLKKFQVISDGGNDMRENFKFIKEHYKGKDKIDMLMILSDFYDPLDGDTETTSICPCVFMCIDHKDFVKPTKIRGEVYPFEVDADK
jgi:predicted metal-dependent peptidase